MRAIMADLLAKYSYIPARTLKLHAKAILAYREGWVSRAAMYTQQYLKAI